MDTTMTVYADGRIELKGRGGDLIGQASAEDLASLQALLASPAFAALDPSYQAAGADLITYEITIPSLGATVVTMDGAATPAALSQVIEALEELQRAVK
jgi:hypothetical protein